MTETVMETALVPTSGSAALQLAANLGAVMTATGLEVSDPDLPFDNWQNLGRCISFAGNAWQWWTADWIILGETLYGEDMAQGIDDHATRFDVARRVTGVEQQTLLNVASVGRRVPRERRREELRFSHHAVVAPLEPEQQIEWLQKAIDELWTVSELREAVREAKNPPNDDPEPGASNGSANVGPTLGERLQTAAEIVYGHAQATGRGVHEVPDSAIHQLGAALGRE